MKTVQVCAIALFVSSCVCFGQKFDVASVKVSQAPEPGGRGGLRAIARQGAIDHTPGSLSLRRTSLSAAIQYAYSLKEYQVTGPDWQIGRAHV